jgi:phage repressor protein C with HTH and peptisase S24 domain
MEKKDLLILLIAHYTSGNKAQFATKLGVTPQTINTWISRNTFDADRIFANCDDLSAEWLLTGKGEMLKKDDTIIVRHANSQTKGIPLLPVNAFAGIGGDFDSFDISAIEERYEIPLFKNIKVDFMIPVTGSSMYPKYSSGDVVACRFVPELLYVQWNKVYVLDTVTQGVIMKRLKKSTLEGYIICKSDNESYEEFDIPLSDIRSIALVVGVVRLE